MVPQNIYLTHEKILHKIRHIKVGATSFFFFFLEDSYNYINKTSVPLMRHWVTYD